VSVDVRVLIDRHGLHLTVLGDDGKEHHREGVGSPTTTVEREGRMTCAALLTPEAAELAARSLLMAAARARNATPKN
jgi:hypothetical protein